MDVMPAAGTSPRLPPLGRRIALEDTLSLGLRALSVLAIGRVASAPKMLQAGGIIGEIPFELSGEYSEPDDLAGQQ